MRARLYRKSALCRRALAATWPCDSSLGRDVGRVRERKQVAIGRIVEVWLAVYTYLSRQGDESTWQRAEHGGSLSLSLSPFLARMFVSFAETRRALTLRFSRFRILCSITVIAWRIGSKASVEACFSSLELGLAEGILHGQQTRTGPRLCRERDARAPNIPSPPSRPLVTGAQLLANNAHAPLKQAGLRH